MEAMQGGRKGPSALQNCMFCSLIVTAQKKISTFYKHNRLIGVETKMYRSFRLLLFSKYTVECYQLRANNGEEI